MTRNHIGVDLAKDFLDICDPLRGEARVPNQPEAVGRWLAGLGATTSSSTRRRAAATGRSGRAARRPGGRGAGQSAARLALRALAEPRQDRPAGCGASGADFGAERQPPPDPALDPAREELRALVQRRDQLLRMQVQEKNRLSACLREGALVARRPRRPRGPRPARALARDARGRSGADHRARPRAHRATRASALDPRHRRGDRDDAARLPRRARAGRPSRHRLAGRPGAAGARHRRAPGQALPRRGPETGAQDPLHGGAERAAPPGFLADFMAA